MGFYGYTPQAKNYSFISMFGNQIADIISKVPEAVELDKAISEGRVTNNDTYLAVVSEVNKINDDDFEQTFGKPKTVYLQGIKPGRNEKPEMYAKRVTDVFGEKYLAYQGMQNYRKASTEMSGIGTTNPVTDFLSSGGTPDRLSEIGLDVNKPIQNKPTGIGASPEQIMQIASKNNVPLDRFQGELTKSINERTGQQLGSIKPEMNQTEAYQAIGGGATPESQKAIGGLTNQYQQGNLMIGGANAEAEKTRAEAGKINAQANLKKANNQGEKDARGDRQKMIKDYMDSIDKTDAEINDLDVALITGKDPYTLQPIDTSQINKRISELEKIKSTKMLRLKKLQEEAGLGDNDVGYENISDKAIKEAEVFKRMYVKDSSTSESVADGLLRYANTNHVSIDREAIKSSIDEGATVEQIIELILQSRPSWVK